MRRAAPSRAPATPAADEVDGRPSKSALKREALDAQRLGAELTFGARGAGGTVVRLVLPVAKAEGGAA